ncbi:RING-type domain-containing protein, partial [Favolaschia claudopus]
MLSLGPGSACDVCLDPFGADSKAPCSILCGHVFCVGCLRNIARPTCPLCRTPFDTRHTIRLHIDLDSITPSSVDESSVPSDADDGARQLQDRITQVAAAGATEAQTTQLTEECKRFLLTVPREMYTDLRTAYKMLSYMCQVKRNFVDQGRTVNQLGRQVAALTQEADLEKAKVESLRSEKERLEESLTTVTADREQWVVECDRLAEDLEATQAHLFMSMEQNATMQNQLLLNDELLRRYDEEDRQYSESSPEGDCPADIRDPISEGPGVSVVEPDAADCSVDPSAPFLTPWEACAEPKKLPLDDEHSANPLPRPRRGYGYCGAAGCPHSCNCMPFVLFSPGSREAQAANARLAAGSDAPNLPSGLSLHRPRSRSRSHSRPRSRSLSRAPSPSPSPSHLALPSTSSASMLSASMIIPNPHSQLHGQLQDLLRDPSLAASLPNMSSHSHFPSSP